MSDESSEFEPPTRVEPPPSPETSQTAASAPEKTALHDNPPDGETQHTALPDEARTQHELGLPSDRTTRHDVAAKGRPTHDTAHDRTAHDRTAHDRTAHDDTSHDGAAPEANEFEPPTVLRPGRLPSAPTVVKPLPAQSAPIAASIDERVTAPPAEPRALEPFTDEPSSDDATVAEPPAIQVDGAPAATPGPQPPSKVPRGAIIAALLGLLLGVTAVTIIVGFDDDLGEASPVEAVANPSAPRPTGPAPDGTPTGPAPPLSEAADLAMRGDWTEAARAYAALARAHPDRPELAVFADVLAQKAGQ